jgi:RNase H-fold protein (predicted Holliday junction resolvase)
MSLCVVMCLNERRMVAFPYLGYRRTSLANDRRKIAHILEHVSARGLVIGLPLAPSGHDCSALRDFIHAYSKALFVEQSAEIRPEEVCQVDICHRDVFRRIARRTKLDPPMGLPIAFADESYSTLLAREKVFESTKRSTRRNSRLRKEAIDSVRSVMQCLLFGKCDRLERDMRCLQL